MLILDFDLFQKHVALAQRIMDDIIDSNWRRSKRYRVEKTDQDPEGEEVNMPNATCGTRYIRRAVKVAVQWELLRKAICFAAALGCLRYGTLVSN